MNRLVAALGIDDLVVTDKHISHKANVFKHFWTDIEDIDKDIQKVANDNRWFYLKWREIARTAI